MTCISVCFLILFFFFGSRLTRGSPSNLVTQQSAHRYVNNRNSVSLCCCLSRVNGGRQVCWKEIGEETPAFTPKGLGPCSGITHLAVATAGNICLPGGMKGKEMESAKEPSSPGLLGIIMGEKTVLGASLLLSVPGFPAVPPPKGLQGPMCKSGKPPWRHRRCRTRVPGGWSLVEEGSCLACESVHVRLLLQ